MNNILINLVGFCIFFIIGYFARIICDFIIRKYKEFKISNIIDKTNYLFSLKRKYENKDIQFKDLIEKEILDNIKYAYMSKHKGLIDFVEKIKNKEDDILFSGKECRKLKKDEENGFICSSFKIEKLFKKIFKNDK